MITLAMIVRNEAPTLRQTLESARACLGKGPTVLLDTGSTDATEAVARHWAKAGRHSLTIARRPFDDFASSRNACLALAWDQYEPRSVFMVDAGAIVRGQLDASRPAGAANVQCVMGETRWLRPQLLVPGWHYVGRVHEYATGPGIEQGLWPCGLVVDYCLRDSARAKRWERDLVLLEGDESARGVFYRAQTLELLGRWGKAEATYCERMFRTDGFWEERVVAALRCIRRTRSDERAELYARLVHELDGGRVCEAQCWLAERAERRGDWIACKQHTIVATTAPTPRPDATLVDTSARWRAWSLLARACAELGEDASHAEREAWRLRFAVAH